MDQQKRNGPGRNATELTTILRRSRKWYGGSVIESGLGYASSLFSPPKTELNDLLQPVFQHMQEKYPDRILLVRMHQAEMFKINDEVRLVNEKLIETFLTGEMLALVNTIAKGICDQKDTDTPESLGHC